MEGLGHWNGRTEIIMQAPCQAVFKRKLFPPSGAPRDYDTDGGAPAPVPPFAAADDGNFKRRRFVGAESGFLCYAGQPKGRA